jgi:hypothetical protein
MPYIEWACSWTLAKQRGVRAGIELFVLQVFAAGLPCLKARGKLERLRLDRNAFRDCRDCFLCDDAFISAFRTGRRLDRRFLVVLLPIPILYNSSDISTPISSIVGDPA